MNDYNYRKANWNEPLSKDFKLHRTKSLDPLPDGNPVMRNENKSIISKQPKRNTIAISNQGFQILLQEMEAYNNTKKTKKRGMFGTSTSSIATKHRKSIIPKSETQEPLELSRAYKETNDEKHPTNLSKMEDEREKCKTPNRKRNILPILTETIKKVKKSSEQELKSTEMEILSLQPYPATAKDALQQSMPGQCADNITFKSKTKSSIKCKLDNIFKTADNHSTNDYKHARSSAVPQTAHSECQFYGEEKSSSFKTFQRQKTFNRFSLAENSSIFEEFEKLKTHRRSSTASEVSLVSSSSSSTSSKDHEDLKQKGLETQNKSKIRSLLKSWVYKRQEERTSSTKNKRSSEMPVIHMGLTLHDILSQKDGMMKHFSHFLKQEFSHENLDFWLEVEEYKKLKNFQEAAVKIYDTYISVYAKHEINLEFWMKKEIICKLVNPDAFVFDEAQRHIFKLMEKDSFQRFLLRYNESTV